MFDKSKPNFFQNDLQNLIDIKIDDATKVIILRYARNFRHQGKKKAGHVLLLKVYYRITVNICEDRIRRMFLA